MGGLCGPWLSASSGAAHHIVWHRGTTGGLGLWTDFFPSPLAFPCVLCTCRFLGRRRRGAGAPALCWARASREAPAAVAAR